MHGGNVEFLPARTHQPGDKWQNLPILRSARAPKLQNGFGRIPQLPKLYALDPGGVVRRPLTQQLGKHCKPLLALLPCMHAHGQLWGRSCFN
jgi:hypothetical protein